jgi:hypothetical protein
MRSQVLVIAVALGSAASAQTIVPPGTPAVVGAPSINSARPGKIQAGADTTMITVYGVGFDVSGATAEAVWNGQSIGTPTVSTTHPGSRVTVDVPASLLLVPGSASLSIRQGGHESNAVTVLLTTDPPPTCVPPTDPAFTQTSARQTCGYALGDLPVLEMVPLHTWYPFVTAPAGGIVKVVNRDSGASYGHHVVTNTTVQDRTPFVSSLMPSGLQGTYFDVEVSAPIGGNPLTDFFVGYVRVPEAQSPGSVIPFFCSTHSNNMNPPLGGITVY